MRLYDTHCHFESNDPKEIAAILARAKAAGVEKLMAVGGSRELNASAQLAAGQRLEVGGQRVDELPEVVCALGYDRDQVGKVSIDIGKIDKYRQPMPIDINRYLSIPTVPATFRALGEIGLDYHYAPETRAAQMELFGEQLELAREKDLPVVIHTREADEDTVALLKEIPSRGIIHCYTGTPAYAKRFLDLGFYISFSGIVTFRAADNVRASVKVVPNDRILIETDSPFLAPVPMRGQPNEPAFIRHTCEFLADFRQMDFEDFAELTFCNANRALG